MRCVFGTVEIAGLVADEALLDWMVYVCAQAAGQSVWTVFGRGGYVCVRTDGVSYLSGGVWHLIPVQRNQLCSRISPNIQLSNLTLTSHGATN